MLTIDRINISVLIILASVSVAQAAAGGEAAGVYEHWKRPINTEGVEIFDG